MIGHMQESKGEARDKAGLFEKRIAEGCWSYFAMWSLELEFSLSACFVFFGVL